MKNKCWKAAGMAISLFCLVSMHQVAMDKEDLGIEGNVNFVSDEEFNEMT